MLKMLHLSLTGACLLPWVLAACAPNSPFDDALYAQRDGQRSSLAASSRPRAPSAPPDRESAAAPFEASEELALKDVVAEVLRRNPTLDAIRRAQEVAAARFPQVTSLDDPMVSYSLAPLSIGVSDVRLGQRIDISQALPWPGKLGQRGRVAAREADAAEQDIDTARQRLIQQAIHAFYDYYYVHRAIEINEANIELLRDLQRIAEDRLAAGAATLQDALRAEVEAIHLEQRGFQLERRRKVARGRLNTLMHRRADADLPPPPPAIADPARAPKLAALQDRAVNARPELRALAAQIEARRASRQLARLDYRPDFTVMGVYNNMWREEEHRWMLGAGINVPLQRERRRGAEAEALAELGRTAADLRAGVDEVIFEVTEAHDRLVEASHVVELFQTRLLDAAEENLEAARAAYEGGEVDFLTLLEAEQSLRNVQLAYHGALTDYHRQWGDLERAVGGAVTPVE